MALDCVIKGAQVVLASEWSLCASESKGTELPRRRRR